MGFKWFEQFSTFKPWGFFSHLGGSSFSPSDLPSLFMFCESDEGVLRVSGDVTSWTGKAPTSVVFNEFGAGTRPLFIESDPNFNGESSMEFDGTVDRLVSTAFGPFTQPNTGIIVMRYLDTGNSRTIYDGGSATERHLFRADQTTGTAWEIFAGGTATSGGTVDSNTHCFVNTWENGPSKLYVDGGAPVITGTTVGTQSLGQLNLGTLFNNFIPGQFRVAAFYFANTLLTSDELNSMGNYISGKYGTAWTDI